VTLSTSASGYAAAVLPIRSAAIHTGTHGLVAGDIEIPSDDARLPGYRAKPVAGTSFPVILVVQEIFGVHEHIRDVCRRLANDGYFAVAPELYFRQGDPSGASDIQELLTTIVSKVPDAQVLSDLDATVRWAGEDGGDTSRLGITGFCWGGRIVWLYAAHSANLKAGVAWYGRLAGNRNQITPKQPIDIAADLRAPVLGLYGGQDKGIPLTDVAAMRDRLRHAGKPSEIIVYDDAEHAFNADYRPSYNERAAKDGWRRMLDFFHGHGVA
jgi:carboxymethylenebutenolidase